MSNSNKEICCRIGLTPCQNDVPCDNLMNEGDCSEFHTVDELKFVISMMIRTKRLYIRAKESEIQLKVENMKYKYENRCFKIENQRLNRKKIVK